MKQSVTLEENSDRNELFVFIVSKTTRLQSLTLNYYVVINAFIIKFAHYIRIKFR